MHWFPKSSGTCIMKITNQKAQGHSVSISETPSNLPELSVSDLSMALKRLVEGEFGSVRVRGEISGFMRAASGHCYLTLKDDRAVIDAVMWKGVAGGACASSRKTGWRWCAPAS